MSIQRAVIPKRRYHKHPLSLALFILLSSILLLLNGCEAGDKKTSGWEDYVRYVSFSPDNKKIIFDRRNYLKGEKYTRIHSYDLETGELVAYEPPPGQHWSVGKYSFDGKKIVFTTKPFIDGKYDNESTQIAIMGIDGKNITKITYSPGYKTDPLFSHSGKKIIFSKAYIRESGRTLSAGYDAYEVDIETGEETRLTFFKFYSMSDMQYFPDDKTIIFSAIGSPSLYPGIAEDDHGAIRKKKEELKEKSFQGIGKRGTDRWGQLLVQIYIY